MHRLYCLYILTKRCFIMLLPIKHKNRETSLSKVGACVRTNPFSFPWAIDDPPLMFFTSIFYLYFSYLCFCVCVYDSLYSYLCLSISYVFLWLSFSLCLCDSLCPLTLCLCDSLCLCDHLSFHLYFFFYEIYCFLYLPETSTFFYELQDIHFFLFLWDLFLLYLWKSTSFWWSNSIHLFLHTFFYFLHFNRCCWLLLFFNLFLYFCRRTLLHSFRIILPYYFFIWFIFFPIFCRLIRIRLKVFR